MINHAPATSTEERVCKVCFDNSKDQASIILSGEQALPSRKPSKAASLTQLFSKTPKNVAVETQSKVEASEHGAEWEDDSCYRSWCACLLTAPRKARDRVVRRAEDQSAAVAVITDTGDYDTGGGLPEMAPHRRSSAYDGMII